MNRAHLAAGDAPLAALAAVIIDIAHRAKHRGSADADFDMGHGRAARRIGPGEVDMDIMRRVDGLIHHRSRRRQKRHYARAAFPADKARGEKPRIIGEAFAHPFRVIVVGQQKIAGNEILYLGPILQLFDPFFQ